MGEKTPKKETKFFKALRKLFGKKQITLKDQMSLNWFSGKGDKDPSNKLLMDKLKEPYIQ
jgi:hypothetical protein